MKLTMLNGASLDRLRAELAAADLPISDLDQRGRAFFRFDDACGAVGYGGIEGEGQDRLLRSLVVLADRRGSGLGAAMLELIEQRAKSDGVATLYLLTTTAETFFRRHGYATADREHAPAAIATSEEFRSLCPASAALLYKRIAE